MIYLDKTYKYGCYLEMANIHKNLNNSAQLTTHTKLFAPKSIKTVIRY